MSVTMPDPARRDFVIRTAAVADIPSVLALWREAAAEPTVTDDGEGLLALIERDDHALLVALQDGELAGTIIAGWDGWRGNLYRLAVRPTNRRRGVALALVRAAEDHLALLGARRVNAGVLRRYPPALEFWRAAGYVFDDRIARHRQDLARGEETAP